MTYHFKHEEVKTLVEADFAVLLTGEKGVYFSPLKGYSILFKERHNGSI